MNIITIPFQARAGRAIATVLSYIIRAGVLSSFMATQALAATGADAARLDLTGRQIGVAARALFALDYLLVIGEEFTHL